MDFNTGSKVQTYTAIFNPASNQTSERLVFETGHNMFCPGTANLPDGRILVNGGIASIKTSIYNPFTNTWQAAQNMDIARGYQGTTVLSTGKVFTLGGSWSGGVGNKDGEVWSAASGWTVLPGAWVDPVIGPDPEGVFRGDNHLWLFGVTGGKVFHAGPHNHMNWYDTNNGGSVISAGNRGNDAYSMNGNATMYDIKKILKVGGAPAYQYRNATGSAYVIDLSNGVAVSKVGSMAFPRAFGTSVVLPNGQVVVVGGQSYALAFTDRQPVLAAEIWDPATRQFTTLASMQIPRTYHSGALLLPDGRVFVGGGGLCGNCTANHPNAEIFSPPYLFGTNGQLANRPVISTAPGTAKSGTQINVTTNGPISGFVLMRLSSVTHTVNNDQRRVFLTATAVGTNAYSLAIPADKGVVLPGYYMLFSLSPTGVPSLSKTVKII
ncbi:MAG: galactose oxidase-like domain-containing protein [Gammaproteobacteria bacterium]